MQATMTTCDGCGTAISEEAAHYGFGMCYQCQCSAHACGAIDMDATDGIEDVVRDRCDDHNDGVTEEEIAVDEGRAEWLCSSPTVQHAREVERLISGVAVALTVRGVFHCDIPF